MAVIKYACPHILTDDIRAVNAVMESGWLTQGKEVPKFEKEIAKYVNAKYAIAFNSATSALFASYKALGMEDGTDVVTTPISYVATANMAKVCGAKVYFQDRKVLTGEFVVPVHFTGRPYRFYGERVVEDASQALGTAGIGSCKQSDICVFSTHAIKNITTAEGGIATTNVSEVADFLRAFRNHGWYSSGLRFPGYNLRMNEMQAALGRSQLKRIDAMRDQKQEVVNFYNRHLSGYVETPEECDGVHWHLYETHLKNKTQRDRLQSYLKRRGIETRVHVKPIYLEEYYRAEGYEQGLCPKAEEHWHTELSLPLHVNLTTSDVEKVVDSVRRFIG